MAVFLLFMNIFSIKNDIIDLSFGFLLSVTLFLLFCTKALDFHVEKCYNFCNISADNQNDISGRGAL